ncbi:hypothetical protein AQUCO_08400026v1 [Aquilegia coerulea]|uniref:Heat shock factor binding protein n=1 Tax=Aquilegia coerulea TaxID=218851 RepID=A0A2G5C6S0_AQUCA|nr:hypothetical protein AQUCO_08400026v1 [Aquilegia coerulea]
MDGHNSEDPQQGAADMTVFQSRFQTMSESIVSKIDDMGSRIDELEQSINDLRTEMGVESSPSSLPKAEETKPADGPATS